MNHNKALAIIDMQRGFMPAEEGKRLGLPGFGELTVPAGHEIIPNLNKLTEVFTDHDMPVVTTQDAHLEGTAHISETPNFVTTWPSHCIKDTPGSEIHPDLQAAGGIATHFIKGDLVAATPEDDDSYTGALAHRVNPDTGQKELLPNFLRSHNITKVYLGGVALGNGEDNPLCVDSTAIDLREQGFQVTVITDAVEAVVEENRQRCFTNLGELGIRLVTTATAVTEVFATPELIR
jgi:nicotinamidase/pyrazinamidase